MSKMKMLLTVVMALGLTLGLAGMASAAKISCGQCHGAIFNNASTGSSGSTSVEPNALPATDPRAVPSYENDLTPSYDNDRGLHGIHMNYSSATYGTGNSTNGRGVCAYCHADNHPNHESGFLQWSTIDSHFLTSGGSHGYTTLGRPLTFLLYSSDQGGMSNRPNFITSMENAPRTGSCTLACHKGTSEANKAPWGNYTSATVVLTCNSCHGDATNIGGSGTGYGLSSPSSKGHSLHLGLGGSGSEFAAPGTGGIKIFVNGTTVRLQNSVDVSSNQNVANAVCQTCHPDNRGQGGPASLVRGANGRLLDWGVTGANGYGKAYPHATDGTNVVSANAVTAGMLTGLWTNTTSATPSVASANRPNSGNIGCTNNCHFNKSVKMLNNPAWNGAAPTGGTSTGCEACHNHTATLAANQSATRPLSFAHSLHFEEISAYKIGVGAHGLPSCNDCHVVYTGLHTNALGVVNIIQPPALNGAAGIGPSTFTNKSGTNWSGAGTITTRRHLHEQMPRNHVPALGQRQYAGALETLIAGGGGTGCATCHEYPGAALDWASTNGHSVRPAFNEATSVLGLAGQLKHLSRAGAYNAKGDTYAGVTGDTTSAASATTASRTWTKSPSRRRTPELTPAYRAKLPRASP